MLKKEFILELSICKNLLSEKLLRKELKKTIKKRLKRKNKEKLFQLKEFHPINPKKEDLLNKTLLNLYILKYLEKFYELNNYFSLYQKIQNQFRKYVNLLIL